MKKFWELIEIITWITISSVLFVAFGAGLFKLWWWLVSL